jgi:hypothetical protein
MSSGFDANFKITNWGTYAPVYNYNLISSKKGIDISMDSAYKHLTVNQSNDETVYWNDQVSHFDFASKLKTIPDGESNVKLQGGYNSCNVVFHMAAGVKYTIRTVDGWWFEFEVLGTDTRVPPVLNSAGFLYYTGCMWSEAYTRVKNLQKNKVLL